MPNINDLFSVLGFEQGLILIGLGIFMIIGGVVLLIISQSMQISLEEQQLEECEQHQWEKFPSGYICLVCKKSPNADIVAAHDPDFY